jgi:hypothetical protein
MVVKLGRAVSLIRLFAPMPIFRQISEALAISCAHFFSVPWQSVVSMLVIIGCFGGVLYLRLHLSPRNQGLELLVLLVAMVAWVGGRRFLSR